ncbi:MAG: SPFH domain-containing protein [Candidatus Saccharimonadales bacterium]|nr:hypothetical protein [Candidatus Saccharibacteria bacterium]
MKTIIYENQRGLLIRDGQIVKELGAGTHKTSVFRTETIVVYPANEQITSHTFSVTSKDANSYLLEVASAMTINDLKRIHLSGQTAHSAVSTILQQLIVDVAGARSLEDVLENGILVEETELNTALKLYGVSVRLLGQPRVRLPRNLQNAIDAQEVARQRAKAELEEARGRSAVIRHYANVAKVTKDNPDLLRLLLGQKAKSINVAFDATEKSSK